MFEHKREQLLTAREFVRRVFAHVAFAVLAIAVALGIGISGYHYLGGLDWIDALVNASMILGGMGPVDTLRTSEGKLFASFYALFSGLFFIGVATVVLAPFVHRLLHRLHVDD